MEANLTIGFCGDVMMGRLINNYLDHHHGFNPWGNTLPLLKSTDITIINLETALTGSNDAVPKTFNFKASPGKVKLLADANVTLANLANNHIKDFGTSGLLETIATLQKAGIRYVGAGRNAREAAKPVVLYKKGITVGVLGYTDNEQQWKATDKPGTNYVDTLNEADRTKVLSEIKSLRSTVDLVIVSIHWGFNMTKRPTEEQVQFARSMTAHGAHLIHGHSAHVLHGIEAHKTSLVLYDTGDFLDDYAVDPVMRNDLSAFFVASAGKTGISELRAVPVRISDYQVNLAQNEDYEWVIQRLKSLSAELDTAVDSDGRVALENRPSVIVE